MQCVLGVKRRAIDAFPQTLLVLVGLPGSGKSTLAARFGAGGWVVVSQDVLHTRAACEAGVVAALAAGRSVVVDRTNVDVASRAVWLAIGARFPDVRCACTSTRCTSMACTSPPR